MKGRWRCQWKCHYTKVVIDDTIYAIGGSGWPQVGAGGPAGGTTEDREFSPTVKVFDTGLRAVTAKGKLPTRWGALKIGRQN